MPALGVILGAEDKTVRKIISKTFLLVTLQKDLHALT